MKKAITLILIASLLLGAGLMAIAADSAKGGTIRLEENSGTVSVLNAGGKAQTIRAGMRLYNGYKVSTGTKSEAYVSLDDTKVVKLDSSTKVDVKQSGKQLEVTLSSGKLFFNVTRPLKADETMNISSSTMVTGIRGSYGWVTPTEVGLMHGHVIVTCRNPYTGETRVTELFSGERVYFDPDPNVTSADPALLEIDFIKEAITNDDVPVTVVREMAEDQTGLCDPVIRDVPTIDVPALLAMLPELEQKEREAEARAEQEMEKALQEEEESMSGDAVDQVFESSVPMDDGGDSGSSGETPSTPSDPVDTKYTVTVPGGYGYTISSDLAEVTSGSGQYEVKEGESFAFTVTPDADYAVFADDLGAAAASGAAVTQTQNGTSVDCSVTVTGDDTITLDRIYATSSHIDQALADAEPYISAVSDAEIDSDVSLPSGSVLRVPDGESLTVTSGSAAGTILTIQEGADLLVEGSLSVNRGAMLYNYSTSSIHVADSGYFELSGEVHNYGRFFVEGELDGSAGLGWMSNVKKLEIASGAKVSLRNLSVGDLSNGAHDDGGTVDNAGELKVETLTNHGIIRNSGTLETTYTATNYNQITNDGTINFTASFCNGDPTFDPELGYGTVVNNGTITNSTRFDNFSFNTVVNNGTINNLDGAIIRNAGTFTNNSVVNNRSSFISVGPIGGSGTVEEVPVDESGYYIVRFDNNGGYGVTTGDNYITPGDTVAPTASPPESSLLKRDGYSLTGWCTDREGKNEWGIKTDPVVSDMTLYAKWE